MPLSITMAINVSGVSVCRHSLAHCFGRSSYEPPSEVGSIERMTLILQKLEFGEE